MKYTRTGNMKAIHPYTIVIVHTEITFYPLCRVPCHFYKTKYYVQNGCLNITKKNLDSVVKINLTTRNVEHFRFMSLWPKIDN